MKRWQIGILITACVIVAAVAAILLAPQPPPFNFLPPGTQVRPILSKQMQRDADQIGGTPYFYSFQGSFKDFSDGARKELLAKGYSDTYTLPSGKGYIKGDGVASKPAPGTTFVVLMRDFRIQNGVTVPPIYRAGKERGWVSVVVIGVEEKGPFDRLRTWIGL